MRSDPFPFWIPSSLGLISATLIFALVSAAGRKSAQQAFDEGTIMDKRRAEAHAFWIELTLYPNFGILMTTGAVALPTAFAAMGTLTGRPIYCCSPMTMRWGADETDRPRHRN